MAALAFDRVLASYGLGPPILPEPEPKKTRRHRWKRTESLPGVGKPATEKRPRVRRDRILKRIRGIVKKTKQLSALAAEDMEFIFIATCRDPLKRESAYNCIATDSDDPHEALEKWYERAATGEFEEFGPDDVEKAILPVIYGFPHASFPSEE